MDRPRTPDMAERVVTSVRWLVLLVVLVIYAIGQYLHAEFDLVLPLLGAALIYNGLLTILLVARRFPPILSTLALFLDGAFIFGLIALTGGTHSPFLLLIFLPLLFITLRSGFGYSLLAALLAILSYIVVALLQEPQIDLDTLIKILVDSVPYALGFVMISVSLSVWAWQEHRRLVQIQRRVADTQKQLEGAYERIQAAYDVAATLRSTMNYERVLEAILTELARFVDFSVGFVLLFGGQGEELRVVSSQNLLVRDRERVLRATIGGGVGRVLAGAEVLTVQDPGRDPGLGQFMALNEMQTALCLALRAGFELFGVVVIASRDQQTYSPAQLNLLQGLINQAVIALQNSMLYQSLTEERDRIIDAEEEARHQLARDLHDGPAQGLAAIVMKTDFIRRLLDRDPTRVKDELRLLEDIARQTTKEVRTLLFQLRPVSLETQGLTSTLHQYAEKLRETDALNVIVEAEELPELDSNLAASVFTIVQEAINNAKKHAGTPDIWVRLGVRDENLLLEIEDRGKGFDVAAMEASYDKRGSLGMLNMRERAERLNGIFAVQSAPGQGTLITIAVPLLR
ncbi:MAG: GAF domain-containing sensor histidine kinase [Chloroflexi bacterium]|nr:GAF domain-containing sensor histidine kinase [Chloroflexota bacterium]MBU1751385.1 GAF domain-containing sensor histidine kinase [Chloroflexota bacterium]